MENVYTLLAILGAFIFGCMLSVQMQNDMYKVLNKEIQQCKNNLSNK